MLLADEPEKEDTLSDTMSDPLSEPPLSGTIDSRGFSEEQRVQGGVFPDFDIEVTKEVMDYLLFKTMTEPIIEEQSTVLNSNEEQGSVHGKEEKTTNPPFKTMIPLGNPMVHLKKLTPQDLKRAKVSIKILKEKPVCKYCDLEFPFLSTMLRHIEQVHERTNRFSCSNCNYACPQRTTMKRHERSCQTGPK